MMLSVNNWSLGQFYRILVGSTMIFVLAPLIRDNAVVKEDAPVAYCQMLRYAPARWREVLL